MCVGGWGGGCVDSGSGEFLVNFVVIYYNSRLKNQMIFLKIGTHCSLYCSD